MATTINFPGPFDLDALSPGVPIQQLQPTVYVKQNWADEWIEVAALYPLEVTWSVAPTLPVATLEMDYGTVRPAYRYYDSTTGMEELNAAYFLKTTASDLVGYFIKIACPTDSTQAGVWPTYRTWYGVIEEAHDEQGGTNQKSGLYFGRVTLVAYGMEKLLADHQILSSFCKNTSGAFEVSVPFDFNHSGPRGVEGNRTPEPFLGTYRFCSDPVLTAAKWSSRDIANYLLTHQVPVDALGVTKVGWDFHATGEQYAPTTDAPLLKADNATTYSLLSQLLDRRRGVVWWAEVDAGEETVWVKADSINPNAVTGNAITIPANSAQVNLRYDSDSLTNAVVTTSDLPRYHQVVVRGSRIRCVGTFSAEDDTLEKAWTDDDEELYEAGATPHPDNTPLKRKQLRNDTVRRDSKLAKVFRLFRIPETWAGEVGNGEGGASSPLFIDHDTFEPLQQNYLELSLEQTLPLLEGVDYAYTDIPGGIVPLGTVNERELPPLCFLRRPLSTSPPYKYQLAEGTKADFERTDVRENERLTCNLSIPQNTMTVRLEVSSHPQHAIAYADFAPLEEDRQEGQHDWRKAVFTLSILSQQHTEAAWPETPNTSDVVRKKLIYAGDQYYRHYVAPNTVVGIGTDGSLIRSHGGWIPIPEDPRDPIPLLQDIARIAAAWYCSQHYVLSLESYRLKSPNDVPLGALVINAGGSDDWMGHMITVNAPVTQIKFSYPRGTGDRTPAARMSIKTWAGELDAVEFVAVKPPPPPRTRPEK